MVDGFGLMHIAQCMWTITLTLSKLYLFTETVTVDCVIVNCVTTTTQTASVYVSDCTATVWSSQVYF